MATPMSLTGVSEISNENIENEIKDDETEPAIEHLTDSSTPRLEDVVETESNSQEMDCFISESTPSQLSSSQIEKEESNYDQSQEQKDKENLSTSSTAVYTYRFDSYCNIPAKVTGCWSEFKENNFTKGCKWSPDGLCILTNSNDNCLRLFNLPEQFYSQSQSQSQTSSSDELNNTLPEMIPVLKMKESETVYDFCWYPLMNSLSPVTCCFVTSSRQNPVHMWDAFTGELRCSYRAYDHMDEMVSASCVAFNLQGEKLFCGFNKMIRIFDLSNPGRCFEERSTKAYGQTGIISCFAFSPFYDKMYAAGSYLKSIGIYSESDGEMLFRFEGQRGGVTHLMFSQDGNRLYSGGRMDPEILCWDIRNPGEILFSMQRIVKTHQRIYFDIDKSGTFLISGNDDGCLSAWDISQGFAETDELIVLDPILSFQLHDDCINGVSFNSLLPIVATTSGQRKFPVLNDDDESEYMFTRTYIRDNSLQLWWAGERPK